VFRNGKSVTLFGLFCHLHAFASARFNGQRVTRFDFHKLIFVHVPPVPVSMREHGAGERRDLRKPCGRPIQRTPRHGLARDPRTHAAEYHSRIVSGIGASLVSFGGNGDELLNGGAVACVKVLFPRTHRTAVRRLAAFRIRRR